MKVIGFVGSPRKDGNTDKPVCQILEGAKETGAETEKFHITQLNIQGCTGCMFCRDRLQCILDDDMGDIIEQLQNADAMVFGSPIYMFQITGQAKLMIDRLFQLVNPDFSSRLKPGKKAILAYTQGNPDEKLFSAYFKTMEKIFGFLGFEAPQTMVVGGTGNKNDIDKRQDKLDEAKKLGKKITE